MEPSRQLKGISDKTITAVGASLSLYAVLYVSHAFDRLGIYIGPISHRSLTLAFFIAVTLLAFPMRKGEPRNRLPWYDVLLILLGVAGPLYLVFFWRALAERFAMEEFYPFEYVLALLTIVITLEISRRSFGVILPLFALFLLIYIFTADHFPGFLYTRASSLQRAAAMLIFSSQGLYGIAMGVAATVIITFVIFSQFLAITPVGQFFTDFAMALFGQVRGGPAKISVVSSALFGTISGSTTANIVATGTFTIPLMKSIGYKPEFAAATEAVSSIGGAIMPPVMGVVAFVMAEWLGISYWSICVAAALPAILYYLAIFLIVDAEAVKVGLHGLPRARCPSFKKTLWEGWTCILPVILLVFCLGILHYSAEYSALFALALLIFTSLIRKETRFGPREAVTALRKVGVAILPAGNGCAISGIIVGALAVTQLGPKISSVIVEASGGHMILILIFAAIAAYIIGIGVAGIPGYIMVVIFVAPALIKFGVPPLATHLFVFYFNITHFITPPVAIGAFVAAGIAGADPFKTGFTAMKLGVISYIVPFMFVYNPLLLLKGPPLEVLLAFILSVIGVILLGWGLGGFGIGSIFPKLAPPKLNWVQRIVCIGSALLLMLGRWGTDLVGLAMGALVLLWQIMEMRMLVRFSKTRLL